MNLNRLKNFLFTLSVLSLLLADNSYAQVPYKPENNFVKGGQFKDLFLPMPIHKKLTHKNIWGAKNALPRDVDNGVEDNEWRSWGGNPVLGTDGKYHIAICRWKKDRSFALVAAITRVWGNNWLQAKTPIPKNASSCWR